MNKELSVKFVSNKNNSLSLYASCKFITYIEDLYNKYKEHMVLSVNKNSYTMQDEKLIYNVITSITITNDDVYLLVKEYVDGVITKISNAYRDVEIEVKWSEL